MTGKLKRDDRHKHALSLAKSIGAYIPINRLQWDRVNYENTRWVTSTRLIACQIMLKNESYHLTIQPLVGEFHFTEEGCYPTQEQAMIAAQFANDRQTVKLAVDINTTYIHEIATLKSDYASIELKYKKAMAKINRLDKFNKLLNKKP